MPVMCKWKQAKITHVENTSNHSPSPTGASQSRNQMWLLTYHCGVALPCILRPPKQLPVHLVPNGMKASAIACVEIPLQSAPFKNRDCNCSERTMLTDGALVRRAPLLVEPRPTPTVPPR
jgi:hypothetical protein